MNPAALPTRKDDARKTMRTRAQRVCSECNT
jgi:hypothetical protein